MTATLFIIAAFIIWFGSLWSTIFIILSLIGGWKKLYKLYPLMFSENRIPAKKYRMATVRVGFVNYHSCVNVSFIENGIILSVIKIFSIMHRPIFIPYKKISGIEKVNHFFSFTRFTVDGKKISIYGKAGDELFGRILPSPVNNGIRI